MEVVANRKPQRSLPVDHLTRPAGHAHRGGSSGGADRRREDGCPTAALEHCRQRSTQPGCIGVQARGRRWRPPPLGTYWPTGWIRSCVVTPRWSLRLQRRKLVWRCVGRDGQRGRTVCVLGDDRGGAGWGGPASQARAAAAAYEAAFAATVPPALVTANRTQFAWATLAATNILGQNTAMIAATEAAYEEMWAQDAAAMYEVMPRPRRPRPRSRRSASRHETTNAARAIRPNRRAGPSHAAATTARNCSDNPVTADIGWRQKSLRKRSQQRGLRARPRRQGRRRCSTPSVTSFQHPHRSGGFGLELQVEPVHRR